MSGLQGSAPDETSRILQVFPVLGCLDTFFHKSSTGDRSMAPRLVTSETGALAQSADGKNSGYLGPVMAPVPSRRILRPIDHQGGDSRESFIQSEAPAR